MRALGLSSDSFSGDVIGGVELWGLCCLDSSGGAIFFSVDGDSLGGGGVVGGGRGGEGFLGVQAPTGKGLRASEAGDAGFKSFSHSHNSFLFVSNV